MYVQPAGKVSDPKLSKNLQYRFASQQSRSKCHSLYTARTSSPSNLLGSYVAWLSGNTGLEGVRALLVKLKNGTIIKANKKTNSEYLKVTTLALNPDSAEDTAHTSRLRTTACPLTARTPTLRPFITDSLAAFPLSPFHQCSVFNAYHVCTPPVWVKAAWPRA